MKSYSYLFIELACFIIPFLASFYPKHAFYKNWKPFFIANSIVALIFIIWDYWFTKIGVWGFNPNYLTGFYIGNLPIEEILFFICIPYACVFSYFAFQYLFKRNPLQENHNIITNIFLVTLFVISIFNIDKAYTAITFFSTSLLLLFLKYKKVNLSYHYLNYLFIFPFFFISNGLLTGSFIEEPIVWYDNAENLGVRIGTIPIEDSIYGMLLIFSNIELFKYFKLKLSL